MATTRMPHVGILAMELAVLAFGLRVSVVAAADTALRRPTGDAYFNKVPSPEIMVLPPYCWAQYLPNIPAKPEYIIPVELCGWATNHLCEGYIALNRAKKKWSDRAERGNSLYNARGNLKYTLTGIRDFPKCPIRADAEKALAEAEQLTKMSGGK